MAAAVDIGGLLLFLLLLATMYRVPGACAQLTRERSWHPLKMPFRLIVVRHLKGFANEVALLLQILLLSALLLATLVRLPEAIEHAGYVDSLLDLRNTLWRDLKDAIASICELLSIFTIWKTYAF